MEQAICIGCRPGVSRRPIRISERIGDSLIVREISHERAAEMVVAAIGGSPIRILRAIKRALKTWEVESITFRRVGNGVQVTTSPSAWEMRIAATLDAD